MTTYWVTALLLLSGGGNNIPFAPPAIGIHHQLVVQPYLSDWQAGFSQAAARHTYTPSSTPQDALQQRQAEQFQQQLRPLKTSHCHISGRAVFCR